jgi:hypothetical protein
MEHYAIDRFEDPGRAVLEDGDGQTFSIPRAWLPEEIREGDVIRVVEHSAGSGIRRVDFTLDPAAREERIARARSLRDTLPHGPKGDLKL